VDIIFSKDKDQKMFNSQKELVKKFGPECAKKIRRSLDDLYAVDNLSQMKSLPGGCHELHGDKKEVFAMAVSGGLRLLFEATDQQNARKPDGGLDWKKVTSITILDIEDYHD